MGVTDALALHSVGSDAVPALLDARARTSRSPSMPTPSAPPSTVFQKGVHQLLDEDAERAASAAASLLSTVAHMRRAALQARDLNIAYDALVVEARVCMLRQLFAPALVALLRATRLPSRRLDPQLVCLINAARDSALMWSDSPPSSYSSAGYRERYVTLAATLRQLAAGGGPPPSQCIAPFSTLVSPLDSELIRLVAESAAQRETHTNAAQGLRAHAHPPFGFLYHTHAYAPASSSVSGPYALLETSKGHWRGLSGAGRRKLVVAYITSEWGDNSVGKEIGAVLASHQRQKFQVKCYALASRLSPSVRSLSWRERAHGLCHGGLDDLSDMPTDAAAARVNRHGVHILVDLNGWMPGHRAAVLALSPAPVQMGYKNYVGTMGAVWEPLLLSDRVCSPPEFAQDYSEHLVLLPRSFYATEDYAQTHPECLSPPPLPGDAGSVEFDIQDMAHRQVEPQRSERAPQRPVIANFNNWKKFDPETVALWARVMRTLPASVLWLMRTLPYAGPEESIAGVLEQHAVARHRMIVSEMLPSEEHLVLKRQADLFLDSLAYNAHSTAVELLWSGVPIVTLAGRGMAARVGASVLTAHAAGVTLARNAEDMEALACRLLASSTRLRRVRLLLDTHRQTPVPEPQYSLLIAPRPSHRSIHTFLALAAPHTRPCAHVH